MIHAYYEVINTNMGRMESNKLAIRQVYHSAEYLKGRGIHQCYADQSLRNAGLLYQDKLTAISSLCCLERMKSSKALGKHGERSNSTMPRSVLGFFPIDNLISQNRSFTKSPQAMRDHMSNYENNRTSSLCSSLTEFAPFDQNTWTWQQRSHKSVKPTWLRSLRPGQKRLRTLLMSWRTFSDEFCVPSNRGNFTSLCSTDASKGSLSGG